MRESRVIGNAMCVLCTLALACVASFSAFAAKDPVAEGFLDWTNVEAKNLLCGLPITPSDLRQRTVVLLVADDAWISEKNISSLAKIAALMPTPNGETFAWDVMDLNRSVMAVVSVRNSKSGKSGFGERFKTPKGTEQDVARQFLVVRDSRLPFYKDLAPAGAAEIAADKLPCVLVYGATSPEPVATVENFGDAKMNEVKKAIGVAKKQMPIDWAPMIGVREPQHCKTVPSLVAKGKPATAILAAVRSSLKSKDPEVAKEAQTIYDAINQHGTMLKLRIMCEYKTAPARAYYDYTQLVRLFPSEKKSVAEVAARLKGNKDVLSLGKMLEKIMLWSSDDFMCKNESEAQKIVKDLQKFKKAIDAIGEESKNARLQGEAMLFSSQLDSLIGTIPTKIQPK